MSSTGGEGDNENWSQFAGKKGRDIKSKRGDRERKIESQKSCYMDKTGVKFKKL